MSLQALVWALRVPRHGDVDDSALRTLSILADYASEQYIAYPSMAHLEHDRAVSRRTIFRHLAVLHEAGLILPGPSDVVAHLPANRRPKVWIVNAWDHGSRGDIGVTPEAPRGDIDPPSGVTTGVTHKEEQEPYVDRKTEVSPARERSSLLVEFPDSECVHGEKAVLWTNPKNGRRAPRCPLCRSIGRIILDKEPTHA